MRESIKQIRRIDPMTGGNPFSPLYGSPKKAIKKASETNSDDVSTADLRKAYMRLASNLSQMAQDFALVTRSAETHYIAELDKLRDAWTDQTEQGYEEAYQMLMSMKERMDDMACAPCVNCGQPWATGMPENTEEKGCCCEQAEPGNGYPASFDETEACCEKDGDGFYAKPCCRTEKKGDQ